MAKMTVLEMTQDILSAMDSDDVNSINDTVESQQVAQTIRTTFFELVANRNWAVHKEYDNLEGVGNPSFPTHLKLPELTKELIWFNYDKQRESDAGQIKYDAVEYMYPDVFVAYTNARVSTNANIQEVVDFGGAKLLIRNDLPPTRWTSFDNEYLVLDSFDNAVESTLQGSKTQIYYVREPQFSLTDTFVPDMPSEAFPGLLAEAKSVCFINFKQEANEKAEQQSRRQQVWLSRKNWRAHGGVRYPDYGRVKRTQSFSRNRLFDKEQ